MAVGYAGRVRLQPGKAQIDPPVIVQKARHGTPARRPVCPEIVVEAAVLLKDHDDVVDLFAQPLQVGRRRGRCPHRRPEASGEECYGSGRDDRFEKTTAALPEDRHHFRWVPR
jgi:hypothetical protein